MNVPLQYTEHGQPDQISMSLVPQRNSLVFFEVTPVSFHQVCRFKIVVYFFIQYIVEAFLTVRRSHKWVALLITAFKKPLFNSLPNSEFTSSRSWPSTLGEVRNKYFSLPLGSRKQKKLGLTMNVCKLYDE